MFYCMFAMIAILVSAVAGSKTAAPVFVPAQAATIRTVGKTYTRRTPAG